MTFTKLRAEEPMVEINVDELRKAERVRDIALLAGGRAAQWCIDTGECFFCSIHNGEHETECTFAGMQAGDLWDVARFGPDGDDGV